MESEDAKQVRAWTDLQRQMRSALQRFGSEDVRRTADFWIDDDNFGTLQHKVYFRNLKMLNPAVIEVLQRLLSQFPSWEIIVAVSVPGRGDIWPDMGLTVRAHEIVDGLQRQYFPKEFQSFEYEGSRRGIDRD